MTRMGRWISMALALALAAPGVAARADDFGGPTLSDPNQPDPPPDPCNADPSAAGCPPCSGNGATDEAGEGDEGHPISVVSGRFYHEETDLVVNGVHPIELRRRYDSQSYYDSPLGHGWAWSFDLQLFEYPDNSVIVRTSCGYKHRFVFTGGAYQTPAGQQTRLTAYPDGTYALRFPRNRRALFDVQGRLTAWEDPNGNRLEMIYDPAGRLPLVGSSDFSVDPLAPSTVAYVFRLTQVRERLADGTLTGRAVSFAYDPTTGRLESATASDGRAVEYVHDVHAGTGLTLGNLTQVLGLEGIVTTYAYQDANDPHNLTSLDSGATTIPHVNTYDGQDRVTRQTFGIGSTGHQRFDFDYSQPLATRVTRWVYNAAGSQQRTAVTRYTYDAGGRLLTHTDALGHQTTWVRDASGLTDRVEVRENTGTVGAPVLVLVRTVDLHYDADGNLDQRVTALDGGETITESWTWEQHWLASHEVVSSADPGKPFRTEHTFHRTGPGASDPITNVKEIKRRRDDGTFETTLLTYDARGFVATLTQTGGPEGSPRADVTTYTWDDLGRLTELGNALGEATLYTYSSPTDGLGDPSLAPPGRYLTQIEIGRTQADGEGQQRRFRYDGRGRLKKVERKNDAGTWSDYWTFTYDSDGNRLTAVDATNSISRDVSYTYDGLERLVTFTNAVSQSTQFAYDVFGKRTRITDPAGRKTSYAYDDRDRLLTVTQEGTSAFPLPAPLVTAFGYDAAGNVTTVTDPKSQVTTYGYDALSRLTSIEQELGQTVTYAYDGRGRLDAVTNARGNVLRHAYEAWGALAAVQHFVDTAADTPVRTVSYDYDLAGNVTSASDTDLQPGPLYSYVYDPLGRVDTATAHYLPGGNRVLDSSYDRFGNRSELELMHGSETLTHAWTYDDLDRLTQANFPGGQTLDLQYFANDDLQTLTHGNGTTTSYTYFNQGPVSTITVQNGSSQLHQLNYTLDTVMNVDQVREEFTTTTQYLYEYAYDGANRLTSANYPNSMPAGFPLLQDEAFAYDPAGNRENPSELNAYDYDANNRILASTGRSYAFDADGSLAAIHPGQPNEISLGHDFVNRLRSYSDPTAGTTAGYAYDPFGRRLRKTVNGLTSWFLWEDDVLLAEYDGAGNRTRRYAYAGGWAPVQTATGSGAGESIYDVHVDHLSTPKLLTVANRSAAWRGMYRAFGEVSVQAGAATSFDLRFQGQVADAESGLHYNRFRHFDASTGRFPSADPIYQRGGINLYEYARSNPVTLSDRLGLCPPCAAAAMGPAVPSLAGLGQAALVGLGAAFAAVAGSYHQHSGEDPLPPPPPPSEAGDTPADGDEPAPICYDPDQAALRDLVNDATFGGRIPLDLDDAETVLDWAGELGYPGARASPGDVSDPSNWLGHPGRPPHIHLPGAGRGGHVPVRPGLPPR